MGESSEWSVSNQYHVAIGQELSKRVFVFDSYRRMEALCLFLPPALAVEVIESVLSVCGSVCQHCHS